MTPEPVYLSPKEAAAHLGLTTRTLRHYVQNGRLTRYTVGPRQVRYRADEITDLIKVSRR